MSKLKNSSFLEKVLIGAIVILVGVVSYHGLRSKFPNEEKPIDVEMALPDYAGISVPQMVSFIVNNGNPTRNLSLNDSKIKYGVYIYAPKAPFNRGLSLMTDGPTRAWPASASEFLKSLGDTAFNKPLHEGTVIHWLCPNCKNLQFSGLKKMPEKAIILVEAEFSREPSKGKDPAPSPDATPATGQKSQPVKALPPAKSAKKKNRAS